MRKLMWFTIGFAAACIGCAYIYGNWIWIAAAAGSAISIGMIAASVRWQKLRIAAVIVLGCAVGLCWFCVYDSLYLSSARNLDGQTRDVSVSVSDYSFETDYGSAVDVRLQVDEKAYNARFYLDEPVKLQPGDVLTGRFLFRLTTVGAQKDTTFHQGNGMFLLAYQRGEISCEGGQSLDLLQRICVWRQKLIDILTDALPEDVSGFGKALLLGDKTGIDYETSTAFKVSGISHIIAVSGLHVSIIFGLLYLITARRRVLTALVGIPIVLLFAGLAGFTPSVVRASIMQCLLMISLLLDKEYDGPTALSFAGLVLLAVNPLVITSVSFQLSFACMAGIVLFCMPIRYWLMAKSRLGRWSNAFTRWLSGSVAVTLSAMVFTTPLVALYFGTVSLISIVMNLLTLWVVTAVFYGLMVVCVCGWFGFGITGAIGWVVAWPIRYILFVAKHLSRIPLAAVYTKSIYIVIWVVFCYALFGVYLCLKKKPAVLFSCVAAIGLSIALAASWVEPLLYECSVTVLDVGQGQSVILQSGSKSVLVDCGGDYSEDAADAAAETLLSMGISRLDCIVVTHYDADHAGGIGNLLCRVDTELLLMPFMEGCEEKSSAFAQRADDAVFVSEDLQLQLCGGCVTVFAPVSYKSSNESSLCVLLQTENCAIMVLGDAGVQTEQILVQRHALPKLDLLVVGHHGSRTSTGTQLLEQTKPTYAVISVGKDNSYGHPADDVLQRLSAFGCKILRTDRNGTVVFRR